MKIIGQILLGTFLMVVLFVGLSFVFGYSDVLYTRTVGKEKQNAQREVFEETQSYVEGKRQEAAKYYREYMRSDEEDRAILRVVVANSFANFDETKLSSELESFVHMCKYGR